jgi:hypothetical protein
MARGHVDNQPVSSTSDDLLERFPHDPVVRALHECGPYPSDKLHKACPCFFGIGQFVQTVQYVENIFFVFVWYGSQ